MSGCANSNFPKCSAFPGKRRGLVTITVKSRISPCLIYAVEEPGYRARFGSTYTKIGTIQRRLAWPLRKDDTQIREAFHILCHSPRSRYCLQHKGNFRLGHAMLKLCFFTIKCYKIYSCRAIYEMRMKLSYLCKCMCKYEFE